MCPKILGINAKLWEDWVFLYADKGQIKVRRDCSDSIETLLTSHYGRLSSRSYRHMILNSAD